MTLQESINRQGGVLKLRPAYVRRFYPDLNRLGQAKLKTSARQSIPERWIGSSIQAINPPAIPGGGLSFLDLRSGKISLPGAIRKMPLEMIGEWLLRKHGPEFRVLVKVLDPAE